MLDIVLASSIPVQRAMCPILTQFHAVFISCSLLVLAISPFPVGWIYFFVVVSYNSILPALILYRKDGLCFQMWLFSFITSLFMIFPDWYLSQELQILVFPDDGFPKIGTVSAYMMGLWAIPFFLILYYSAYFEMLNYAKGKISIGAIALCLFGSSEMLLQHLGSWHAVNVHMFADTAIYILFPEVLLGYTFSCAFLYVRHKPLLAYIVTGFLIMLLYLGSATFSFFIMERILLA